MPFPENGTLCLAFVDSTPRCAPIIACLAGIAVRHDVVVLLVSVDSPPPPCPPPCRLVTSQSDVALARKWAGLGAALLLPEVVVLDAGTKALLSTDCAPALLAGTLPRPGADGWRTNVFDVVPQVGLEGHVARLCPDAALAAGLYPGDPVCLKPVGGMSLVLYANPPLEEGEEPAS